MQETEYKVSNLRYVYNMTLFTLKFSKISSFLQRVCTLLLRPPVAMCFYRAMEEHLYGRILQGSTFHVNFLHSKVIASKQEWSICRVQVK